MKSAISAKRLKIWMMIAFLIIIPCYQLFASYGAGNIHHNTEKFAWSESTGWINARAKCLNNGETRGITVHKTHLSGYAWSENIGWIKLGATGSGPYATADIDETNWGVNMAPNGSLSGFAWSEHAGWINFTPGLSSVVLDISSGIFSGYAWCENIGYIKFRNDLEPEYNLITPRLNISDETVEEGVGNISFTVTMTPATNIDVKVLYQTLDGRGTGNPDHFTATSSSDYQESRGSITIYKEQTSKTINIPVSDNTEQEPKEYFRLQLYNPSGASINKADGIATILDDDGHTISLTVGEHGSISTRTAVSSHAYQYTLVDGPLTSSVLANHKDRIDIKITPDSGYEISSLIVNNQVDSYVATGMVYKILDVREDYDISVSFTDSFYDITIDPNYSNGYCSVTYGSATDIPHGSTRKIKCTPQPNYHLDYLNICGDEISLAGYGTKIIEPEFTVVKDCLVQAQFEIDRYTIKAYAQTGEGTITPVENYYEVSVDDDQTFITVDYDTSPKIRITPEGHHHIQDININGQSVFSNCTFYGEFCDYTFESVQSNYTMAVAFEGNSYTLAMIAGDGGYIQYTNSSGVPVVVNNEAFIAVDYNGSKTIKVFPNGAYNVADVKIDGLSQPRQTTNPFVYTFSQIRAHHSIRADFSHALVTLDPEENWGTFTASYYANIQNAVNAVADGEVVAVDPGIYDKVDFSGINSINKNITIFSTQGPEVTFIDGNKEDHCLLFDTNTQTIRLSGFTIQNGLSTNGGAIYIKDASPEINDCRIINNEATQNGGGIFISEKASPELSNLYVRGNIAGIYGGAIYCDNTKNISSPLLFQSIIRGNKAMQKGGGIFINGDGAAAHAFLKIASSWIVENNSYSDGAAIYVNNAEAYIFATTISKNTVIDGFGGAIYVSASAHTPQVTIKNSILWNNGREIDGNKDIIDVTYSNIQVDSGEYGNISDNNRNIDPIFENTTIGDYHLTSTSRCIDVGSPDFPSAAMYQKDIDDRKRVNGTVIDLGGDEWNNTKPQINFSANITSGYSPLTVQFTNNTTNPDSTTLKIWEFGDGSISNEDNPSHMYQQSGLYTIQLTVYDSKGYSATRTRYDYILVEDKNDQTIIVDFIAAPTNQSLSKTTDVKGIEGYAPLTVKFINLTTPSSIMPPSGEMTPWDWNFGDGGTSEQESPSYQYSTAGTYTVELMVSSQKSGGTTLKNNRIRYAYVTVLDPMPQADFDIVPPICAANTSACTVTVYDRSVSYYDIVKWNWDFGDDYKPPETNNPDRTHPYVNVDTFNNPDISLMVTDIKGNSHTVTKSLSVKNEILLDVDLNSANPAVYTSIQSAIEGVNDAQALNNKVVIQVDEGVYYENLNFADKSLIIQAKNGHNVIIDGKNSDSTIQLTQGQTVILDGLTIRNGKAEYGAGILVNNGSNVIIRNCKIINNQATIAGGGIAFMNGSGGVVENTIIGEDAQDINMAPYGAGIACLYDSSPHITGQTYIGYNAASINGGGIFAYSNSNPVIKNTLISSNTANNGFGGGLYASQAQPRIELTSIKYNEASSGAGIAYKNANFPFIRRAYIQKNVAGKVGGGIYASQTIAPQFINTLIADNRTQTNGAGLYLNAVSSAYVLFSTISNNTAVDGTGCGIYGANTSPGIMVTNSILKNQGGQEVVLSTSEPARISHSAIIQTEYLSDTNVSEDPKFLIYGTSTPDYQLGVGSPCQDEALKITMVQRDLLGNARYIGSSSSPVADMGAYESGTWPITFQYDANGKVIGPDSATIASGAVSGISHQGSKAFTVMPLTGYRIDNVTVDGNSVLDEMTADGVNMTYTFTNVTAAHTFKADFLRYSLTVSINYQHDSNNSTTNPKNAEVDMTAESEGLVKNWPLPGVVQQLSVYYGSSLTLTAIPAMTTDLVGFSSGQPIVNNQSVLISNITENMTITVTFYLKKFNISTMRAGDGQGVIQSTSTQVKYGENVTLTAAPDPDSSQFDGWSGFVTGTNTVKNIDNITQDITVTGTFSLKTLIVQIRREGSGGSLTGYVNTSTEITPQLAPPDIDNPDGKILSMKYGDDLKLTAIYPGSWKFDGWSWTGNGDGTDSLTTHEWINIHSGMFVTAHFSINNLTVTIQKNSLSTGSGVVYVNDVAQSLPSTITVSYGGSLTAKAVADTYSSVFSGWSGHASGIGNALLTNITSNKTIYANFQLKSFSIIASATTGGSIDSTGMSTVSFGETKIYTFEPDGTDAYLSDLIVDGVSQGQAHQYTYTFSNVSANHTIDAIFNKQIKVGSGGYSTIQKAINLSVDGDTVLVKPGIYEENINFKGTSVHVKSEIPYQAIIDGNYSTHTVQFVTNETSGAKLSGFIVRHGAAKTGGGIYIDDASPTIEDCRIEDNSSLKNGGGIFITGSSSPLVISSTIQNNISGDSGGGVYCFGATPTLSRSVITNNQTDKNGGGVYVSNNARPILVNMVIYDNLAKYNGGGVYVESASLIVRHCTISDNQSGQGLALFVEDITTPDQVLVQNSILWQTDALTYNVIGADDGDAIQVTGSNVYVKNGSYPGEGNIKQNPLFASQSTGNYRIKNGSPCINAGLSLGQDAVTVDHDGYPRPYSNQVDMGAFEWNDSVLHVDFYASDLSGNSGMEVLFKGYAFSGDAGYDWDWDFGNSTTASVQNSTTITYSQPGQYKVLLTVTDNNGTGQTLSCEKTIVVKEKPSANFIASTTSGFVPLTVEFTDTSQSHLELKEWDWTFGDGGQDFNKNPKYLYTIPGTYQVKLVVTDSSNNKDTAIKYKYINVMDVIPEVNFSAKPSIGNAPLTVQFYDTTFAYQDFVSREWNFGDTQNITSNLRNPVHTFNVQTEYNVSLKLNDLEGSYLETKLNYINVVGSGRQLEVCSPGCAYYRIQDAIDAAIDGDVITVHDGVYLENISFKGKDIQVVSLNGPSGASIKGSSLGSVVTFNQGESSGAILEGFTLYDGKAPYGGGILIANSSSPCISNCTIKNNTATKSGGGIAVKDKDSNPSILGVQIHDNTAPYGGGIACLYEADPLLRFAYISHNFAEDSGGGIYLFAGARLNSYQVTLDDNISENYGGGLFLNMTTAIIRQMTISNNDAAYGSGLAMWSNQSSLIDKCLINNNRPAEKGGGIYAAESESPEFRNTIISNNDAVDGGGIYFSNVSAPFVHFSTVVDNHASGSGNGIHVFADQPDASPQVNIRSSILWNGGDDINSEPGDGKAMITYSDIADTNWQDYSGNINSDPMFTTDETYHLDQGSPCKNRASDLDAPITDIDSDKRPLGKEYEGDELGYDMGADESTNAPPVAESRTENVLEDIPTDIQLMATDEDGDEMTYEIYQLPTKGTLLGTGASRTYKPDSNYNGPDSFTFKVNDGNRVSKEATVYINVIAVNDRPEFSIENDISVYENGGLTRIENWVKEINAGASGHTNESNQMITFEVSADKTDLFSLQPSIANNGTITFTPAPNKTGIAVITVRLKDDGGTENNGADTSDDKYFSVNIIDVNDAPTFTINSNYAHIEVWEDAITQSISQFAQNISPGAETELDQRLWFEVTSKQSQLFSQMPSIHDNGTLTFIPAPNANGTATLTIYLKDDGGTNASGRDTSDPKQCIIDILPVNDKPNFTPGPEITVDEDDPAQIFPLWAGNPSPGATDESTQILSYILESDYPELFSAGPGITSSGTLTFTPAPDANGTANITVRVKDNGGTDRNGEDTSNPKVFVININAINDPPSFVPTATTLTFLEDSGKHDLEWATQISAGASNESGQTLSFHVTTNQQSMFDYPPTIWSSNGYLSFTLKPNAFGKALVSVYVEDSAGLISSTHELTIDVTEINDIPSFNMAAQKVIVEDSGEQRIDNWVDNINAGPDSQDNEYPYNESDQPIKFLINTNNDDLFSRLPSITSDGTLILETSANANGSAVITVTLEDEGTTNGALDKKQSVPKSFTLSVTPVNDSPSFTVGANIEIYEDSPQQAYLQWAKNIIAGPSNESDQTLSFSVTSNNSDLFSQQPTISLDGDLVFTPKANASGMALVSVVLKDSGGISNSGQDTSSSQQFTINILPICDAPSFSLGPDITVFEDSGLKEYVNWVTQISPGGGADESKQQLFFHVGVQGGNDLFVEMPKIIVEEGIGSLLFEPLPNANGEKLLNVFLEDSCSTDNGGINTSSTLYLTINVEPVNDQPSFDLSKQTLSVLEDAGTQTIPNFALNISPGPPDESDQTLTFQLANNNNSLFATQPQMSSDGTLTFRTATDQYGDATVTIYLNDGQSENNTSASKTFIISVMNVNDEPSFTIGVDQSIKEDSRPQQIAAWATNIHAGSANESSQRLTFVVESSDTSLFSIQPQVRNDGMLMYTPAPDAFGTAEIRVTLTDDGGIQNNGDNTSSTKICNITLRPVNDRPSFIKGPNISVDEDSGQQHIVNWASSVSPGPLNEYTQELQFVISTNNNDMFASMPSVDSFGNLTFKPADDAFGSASVRLYLQDNGGTDDGGIDESIYQEFTLTINPVNDPPSYNPGSDVIIYEDSSNQVIANWAQNISAGATNEDQLLTFLYDIENGYLFSSMPEISQDGTLMFTPEENQNGVAKLTLWIEDDSKYGSKMTSTKHSFRINILPVNDKPTFLQGPDQTVYEDSGNHVITEWASSISAGSSNEAGQALSFHVTTDNQSLFQRLPEVTPEGDLSFQPAANTWGTATVTLTLSDNGGTINGGRDVSDAVQVTIKVLNVNDAPGFTKGPDQLVVEEAGLQNISNWATNINAGPPDESDQNIVFLIDVDKPLLFEIAPTISENGLLSYKPAADASGVATVTVSLKDTGGTSNGGVDTSADQTFTITIEGSNDPPIFVKGSDQSVVEDASEQIITGWATQISAGGPGEETQILTFVISVDDESLFDQLPEISSTGTLTYKPRSDQFGETNVSVYLQDNGPGTNMSPSQEFNITIIPVNDRPTFVRGENIVIFEDKGEQALPNWVTNIKPGPWNEESQTLTFQIIPDDPSLFASGPYISELGKLTYTPALNRNGDVSLRIYLKDSGGTEHGGQNTSEPQDFNITIIGINDPPTFALQGSQHSVLEDQGRQMVSNWAANIRPGPSDEANQNVVFRVTNNNTALFSEQPAISPNGILTYTPKPDASGEVKVLAYLEDDGGTANGGINVSSNKEFIIKIIGVNDPPIFTKGPDQRIQEDSGAKIIANWAQNISPGALSEIGQTLTFELDYDPNSAALFTYPPEISSVGTLTFTPAPNASGTIYINVTLKDDGGVDYGGDFTSDVQQFKIDILPTNDPPIFTLGPNQLVLEDSGEQIVAQWATNISAGSTDENNQILTFITETTHSDMFTSEPVVNVDGTLHYILKDNVSGTASVKVTLKDNGSNTSPSQNTSDTKLFTITVLPVNDSPSFVKGVDQVSVEDASEQSIENWARNLSAGPDDESSQILAFEIFTDNDELFAIYPTVSTINGTLVFQSKPDMSGVANVSIRLKDDGGTDNGGIDSSPLQIFSISVYEVNDQPTFSPGPDQLILEDAGEQQIIGWAKNISPGPSNESGQSLTFHVNPDNESLFAILPEVDSTGKLTYTPKNDIYGSTLVTVYLQDNGGLENGGNNTSPMHQFTIHIESVNDAPSFTPGPGKTVIKSSGLNTFANWATAISPGPSNESGQALTFYTSATDTNSIFQQQPTVSPTGTLAFAVQNGHYGTATVSVYLKDDGGTLNGGADRSETHTINITVIDANAPPIFVKGADQTVPEDSGENIVTRWATGIDPGAPDETDQAVQFMVMVNKPNLFSTQPQITPEGNLSFTPAPDLYGQAIISAYLQDDGGTANGGDNTSDPQEFIIDIYPVNDAPDFRMENEHISYEDDDVQMVLNWAYNISPGPDNESSQAVTFQVTTEKPEMFQMVPEITPAGALRYQAALNENGESIISVVLKDDGGRDNGGQDTSNDLHFKITITARNDAPVNTSLPYITGIPKVGETLTAHLGEWNDNIDKIPGSLTYMYQWQIAFDKYGSNLSDINGQTQKTLGIIASDNERYIRVKVKAYDDGEGFPVSLSRDAYSRFVAVGKDVADIDGNGTVDLGDAILTIRALSNMSSETPLVGGDIDGDGKIGLPDIIYVLVTLSK